MPMCAVNSSFIRVCTALSNTGVTRALGIYSRDVAERDQSAPRQAGFINALNDLSAGRVIPLPGAAPEDGKLRTMAGMRPLAARSIWNESGALAAHC